MAVRPLLLLLFPLLLSFLSLAVANNPFNGTLCASYAPPGLVFPGPDQAPANDYYLQQLCLTFGIVNDTNMLNVSSWTNVQLPQGQKPDAELGPPILVLARASYGGHTPTMVQYALPRYDAFYRYILEGVGQLQSILLSPFNDSSCYASTATVPCCPMCPYVMRIGAGLFSAGATYYADNTTQTLNIAAQLAGSQSFFALQQPVSLTCTVPGTCAPLAPSPAAGQPAGTVNGVRWMNAEWAIAGLALLSMAGLAMALTEIL